MAYALGPLRPDERHERIFARRRARRAAAVVAVAVVLGAAGGLFAINRMTARAPATGEVPLIRADDQPTRKRPDNPGGMQIAGQGTLVLDGARGEPATEQLLPLPEAPLPRPAPAEPATETAPQPIVAAPPAAAPAPAAVPTAPAPAPVPPKPKPAAAPAAPAPAAAGRKLYWLQLGAVRTRDGARREWERLRAHNGDVLGKLGYTAPRVDLGERGVFYRIEAGPFADAARAERECGELKRRGVGCILVKP